MFHSSKEPADKKVPFVTYILVRRMHNHDLDQAKPFEQNIKTGRYAVTFIRNLSKFASKQDLDFSGLII